MEILKTNPDNIFWDRISERAEETIHALKNNKIPQVIRFVAYITDLCNMNCTYCKRFKSSRIMSREFFRNLCLKAGKNGIIHITGGEPLIVPWLQEEIYNLKDITKFALNSNLLLLPNENILTNIFRVKTSLDDYSAESWNTITGGKYFDTVVDNIKKVSEIVPHTSVSFCATHQNTYKYRHFIYFCKTEFPKLYSVSASFYKGYNPELILTQRDIDELFLASDFLDPISKQIFLETHSRRGNYFPENIRIPCYLSMTERLYDPDGVEYFCSHLFRDGVAAPGNPGKDVHCITGCNHRFNNYNLKVHQELCL